MSHHPETSKLATAIKAMGSDVEQDEDNAIDILPSAILTEAEKTLESAKKWLTQMEGNLTRARTTLSLSMPLTANSSVESFEPEDAAASRSISASHLGQTNTRPSVEPCSGLSRVNILNHARAKSASFEKVNFVSELFPSPCRSPSNLGAPTQQRPQDRSSASMMLENALNPNTLEDFNYVFPVRTRFRSQSQQFSCDSRDQISRTKQRVSSLSLISQEGFRGSCNSRPVQGYEDMAFRRQSIGRTVETDDVDLYPTAAVGSRKMIQCVDIHNLPPPTQREQYGLQASRGWHNSQLCAGRRNSSYSTTPSLLPPASSNSVEGYGQDDHSSYVQDLPRHEDRLDAFDYQNFILHSALGHYFSDRPPSRSSVGSNTTARPFENIAAGGPLHSRSNSMDSISTFATFATATEGFESPPDEDRAADDNISRLYKSVKKTKTEPRYKHTTFFQSHTGTEPSLDIPLVCSMDPQPTSPKAQEISPHMSLLNRLSSTFIESLLASAAKFRSEDNDSAPNPACFDPQDVELLEHLVGEISRIGFKLLYYSVPGLPPASSNQIGVLRSRLDAVRQILEGQPDT